MKKFYLCKLCLIVFGVSLAASSAFAEKLPAITAEEILRHQKEQIDGWSTQWSCTQEVRAGENLPYGLRSDGVGLSLTFDVANKIVTQRYRDAEGAWVEKQQNDFKILFRNGGLAVWQFSIPTGYRFRLSAFAFNTGKFEQRFVRLAGDLDKGYGQLTSVGILDYDCTPLD